MEEVIRVFDTLAEVTHTVMLHEGITRQLFTYLFFFTNANVFNTLMDSKLLMWQFTVDINVPEKTIKSIWTDRMYCKVQYLLT